MSEEGKIVSHHHEKHNYDDDGDASSQPPPPPPVVPEYGTFQGVPSSPAMGFPQPAPPPGAMNPPPDYYTRGYQAVPGLSLYLFHCNLRMPFCDFRSIVVVFMCFLMLVI